MIPYVVPVDKDSAFHLLQWLEVHFPWLGYVFLCWLILMQVWLVYIIVDLFRMTDGLVEKFTWFVFSLGVIFLIIVLNCVIYESIQ